MTTTRTTPPAGGPAKPKAAESKPREGYRDTVEQLAVALILAFLVRGFAAEAFVIPTGSMAPTLMGRHKEVDCPQCGRWFPVNASSEEEALNSRSGRVLEFGTCDNCRHRMTLQDRPSFKGDRILVMKALFNLPFLPGVAPRRWDVTVFRYPEKPDAENYIKRLVGMPDEDLRIYGGDILTRAGGDSAPFRFQRRPLHHQRAMQMLVYDDRLRPKAFVGKPEWARWRASGGWSEAGASGYETGATADWSTLRYRHLVPGPAAWRAAKGGASPSKAPRASLITDFYAYNTFEAGRRAEADESVMWNHPNWVGDLTLSFSISGASAAGVVRVDLVRGGVAGRCEIDLAGGKATLFHGGRALGEPRPTGIAPGSGAEITLANVDGRLTLWVDGRTPFGDGLEFEDGSTARPGPTVADLEPASVAVKGTAARVSDLVLKRDIYYTLTPGEDDPGLTPFRTSIDDMLGRLSDPANFGVWGNLKWKDYHIRPGHYMMLGDNSPQSRDGRQWGRDDQIDPNFPEVGWDPNLRESWEVPKSLIIGEAFCIYWPHGVPVWPNLGISRDIRVPFRPYFERMGLIR